MARLSIQQLTSQSGKGLATLCELEPLSRLHLLLLRQLEMQYLEGYHLRHELLLVLAAEAQLTGETAHCLRHLNYTFNLQHLMYFSAMRRVAHRQLV
jgi:hypothetical protein